MTMSTKRVSILVFSVLLFIGIVGSNIRSIDLWTDDRSPGMYAVPDVEPAGWSRDGHFAYSLSRTLEGIGGTRYEYRVINAVTDEEVFFERYDETFDGPDPESGEGVRDLNPVERLYADALERYGIISGRGTEFQRFPLDTDYGVYDVEIRTEPAMVETTPMDYIDSWEVRVVRQTAAGGRTSKRITGGDEIRAADLTPLGAFVSPYEARMLVVVGREAYVFEGTEGFLVTSGAHLTYGYE